MAEETKETKTTATSVLPIQIKALVVILIAALAVSVYFNLNPTGMAAADNNNGGNGDNTNERVPIESPYETFDALSGEICEEGGKPLVLLFSTTQCPHCDWIKETFDTTVQPYVDEGKIAAYHWELDIDDDTLTETQELGVPTEHLSIYGDYSGGYVPTFVFGCKYYRIGNGYESEYLAGTLTEEEALQKDAELFKQLIEDMLSA